jgi:Domain of unknown function (DUF5679)
MLHASKRANLISKHEKYGKLTTEGYCMKCKVRRDMRDEKRVRMKDGRSGISGMCTACGGKIFRMVGAAAKTTGKISSKKRTTNLVKEKRKAKNKRK